jgi:hypothetical protein
LGELGEFAWFPPDVRTMTRFGRWQGDGVANAAAACGPVCLGGVGVASRHRGSRATAATQRFEPT